jgi:hypothetical protein
VPLSEIYIKLVVGFPRDPKVRGLVRYGADAGLARDLYVQMCLYCRENLTDGFVVAEEIGALAYPLPPDHANQLAKQLASVGLTKEETKHEAQGWQIVAYVRRNGTREDVERLSQIRAEAGRRGGRPPGHRPGKPNGNQIAKQNKSRPNPETETESETESLVSVGEGFQGEDAPHAPPARKRGTRIPGDFQVTPEMVTWSRRRCPNTDGRTETEKFINHWSNKPGREALKLDWTKAWQNWMLTAEQQAPRQRGRPGQHTQSPVDPSREWEINRA